MREIKAFHWRVLKISTEAPALVISDRPIRMWGRNERIEGLLMPISPRALFVAGTTGYFENEISLECRFRESLSVQCIGEQFRQAQCFVVAQNLGPNDGYLKIAEEYMRMPEGLTSQ